MITIIYPPIFVVFCPTGEICIDHSGSMMSPSRESIMLNEAAAIRSKDNANSDKWYGCRNGKGHTIVKYISEVK